MSEEQRGRDVESKRQVAELSAKVARNRVDIDAQGARVDALETRAELDRKLIAQLRADELVSAEHMGHLQEALRTSRMIATAMGVIMANFGVRDTEAFDILSRCSRDSNRKLVAIASEIVDKGDASWLHRARRVAHQPRTPAYGPHDATSSRWARPR